MDRVRNTISLLKSQLWLVPAFFVLGATALAFVLLTYGTYLSPDDQTGRWWLYSGEAGTARELLSSLLSGLMTMTSLVVSVTFVILALAANQLGPQLISIFMGDRQIQAVLGLFIGTILYVILILRTLDDTLGSEEIPHLAVTVASLLTVLCLLALLFYIHKIARSIIADNVVEAVAQGYRQTLRSVLPADQKQEPGRASWSQGAPSWPIEIGACGYLQVVDYDRLVDLARDQDIVLKVEVRAGQYLLHNGLHVRAEAKVPPGREVVDEIRSAFTIGATRTPAQDPEHGIRQLVEIATRALSPGINDPFTAKAVIDRLGAVFEEIFSRGLQPRVLRDEHHNVRVIADRADVQGLLDAAFHPIRQAGANSPATLIRIADTIHNLVPATKTEEQRIALGRALTRLSETASLNAFAGGDCQDINDGIRRARLALNATGHEPRDDTS